NRHRGHLDVFAGATWYSWDELASSMDRLAGLRVDWVFPGHGIWQEVGAATYTAEMAALGPALREHGQARWRGLTSCWGSWSPYGPPRTTATAGLLPTLGPGTPACTYPIRTEGPTRRMVARNESVVDEFGARSPKDQTSTRRNVRPPLSIPAAAIDGGR